LDTEAFRASRRGTRLSARHASHCSGLEELCGRPKAEIFSLQPSSLVMKIAL